MRAFLIARSLATPSVEEEHRTLRKKQRRQNMFIQARRGQVSRTSTYHAYVMEEGLEQVIVAPHVEGLHRQRQVGRISQLNVHDFVAIVACRLRRGDRVHIQDCDIRWLIPGAKEVQRCRGADGTATSHDDDFGALAIVVIHYIEQS